MDRIHKSRVVAFTVGWPGHWDPIAHSEEVVDDAAGRWQLVRKEDGATVFISATWRGPGKLYFSGTFPSDGRGNSYLPYGKHHKDFSINISVARSDVAIGREVARRLLSVYLPTFADACQRKQEDYKARQEALVRHLADLLLPLAATVRNRNGDPVVVDIPLFRDGLRGELTPNGDTKVDAKLTGLTVAQAEAICRVLVNLAQEEVET